MFTSEKFFTVCRWFNIQLTTAFGIVTTIHWSVLAFIFFLLVMSGTEAAWVFGIAMLSVVPHEYGHSVTGQYYGIKTQRILIYPIGGVAIMEGMPKKWYQEAVVALAGPAVSIVLALIGLLGLWMEGPTKLVLHQNELIMVHDIRSFWVALCAINISLAVFNLLPAFPMDGGRVLRSVLSGFVGLVRATKITYYVACFMAGLMFFAGLYIGNLSLSIISILIVMMARQEYEMVANS